MVTLKGTLLVTLKGTLIVTLKGTLIVTLKGSLQVPLKGTLFVTLKGTFEGKPWNPHGPCPGVEEARRQATEVQRKGKDGLGFSWG